MTRAEYIIDDDFLDDETKMSAKSQGYLWELIRCKDCARWATGDGKTGKCSEFSKILPRHATVADFFCAWAKPKETEK